ncbi:MAG: hypothetical protein Kow00121_04370 [Elainellaceae cyanobacterium]
MSLTTGSALQGNKYVIEAILNQCELGITYRANHTYLDQSVVLQTLNQAAQQRQDFPQLKQQFMQNVQAASKQPSSVRVLDGFEEEGLPFVVLQCASEQVPTLSDWLSLPASIEVQNTNTSLQANTTESSAVSLAQEAHTSATSPLQATVIEPVTQADRPLASHASTAQAKMPTPAPSSRSLYLFSSSSKAKPRLPVALMVVALLGGCTGAGMGFALRLSSASPEGANKPRLTLFNREQSFPSEGRWPIQERPVYTSEPTIEQPLYRTTPEYVPDASIEPLPLETAPFSPSPLPEIEPYQPEPDISTQNNEPPLKSQPKPPIEPAPLNDPLLDETTPSIDTLPPLAPASPISPSAPLIPTPLPPASDGETLPPNSTKPGSSLSRVISQ